jgi:glutamate synthase (NADPH/NADH) small chain
VSGVGIDRQAITARGKHVIIIGGGDTGSDCAGTCLRQGAKSVRQFELLPQPPENRSPSTPWPYWPMQLRTSHAHEEGCERDWSIATTEFSGSGGTVRALHAIRVESHVQSNGRFTNQPIPGSEHTIEADLVLIAMGFAGVQDDELLGRLGVREERGSVVTGADHSTDTSGVFAAGDARRGASLIVWAIREGRDAAAAIDRYLRS